MKGCCLWAMFCVTEPVSGSGKMEGDCEKEQKQRVEERIKRRQYKQSNCPRQLQK